MKKVFVSFALFLWVLQSVVSPAYAETLTPELQAAFDKGMAAAEQSEWPLAIKYFSEVEKGQAFYYPVYFNLALAHAKAGNELAAIAWFRAYLAGTPKAPERSKIEKELTSLEVALEAKMRKILKQADDLSMTLPEQNPDYARPRDTALSDLFSDYANAGMIDEAAALLSRMPSTTYLKADSAKQYLATSLVYEGDIPAAEKMASALAAPFKFPVYGAIIGQYPYAFPDADKALSLAKQITDSSQDYTMINFIESLGRNGHTNEALGLLDAIKAQDLKTQAASKLAKAAAEKGDMESAKKVLLIAVPLYQQYAPTVAQDAYSLSRLVDAAKPLCEALIAAGEPQKARAILESVDLSKLDSQSDWTRLHFIDIYCQLEDLTKAESVAAMIYTDPSASGYAKRSLLEAYIKKNDAAKAQSVISGIRENGFDPTFIPRSYAQLGWVKLKSGDKNGVESAFQAMPKLNSWDKPGSTVNEEQFYVELCALANKDGDAETFRASYAKIKDNLSKAQLIRLMAYRFYEKGNLDGAQKMLLESNDSVWDKDNAYLIFDALGFDIVKARIAKNDKAGAEALLDRLFEIAKRFERFEDYEKILGYYKDMGRKDKASELAPLAHNLKRVQLARTFGEDADLVDPDAYFKKIQSEKPESIPGKMGDYAVKLASGLRKLERMESVK